jgi:hypothetical protein
MLEGPLLRPLFFFQITAQSDFTAPLVSLLFHLPPGRGPR